MFVLVLALMVEKRLEFASSLDKSTPHIYILTRVQELNISVLLLKHGRHGITAHLVLGAIEEMTGGTEPEGRD